MGYGTIMKQFENKVYT